MDKDSTCQWKAIAVYEGKWNVTLVYHISHSVTELYSFMAAINY